jgi:hypothetical protein
VGWTHVCNEVPIGDRDFAVVVAAVMAELSIREMTRCADKLSARYAGLSSISIRRGDDWSLMRLRRFIARPLQRCGRARNRAARRYDAPPQACVVEVVWLPSGAFSFGA